jgi:hypothetical protein
MAMRGDDEVHVCTILETRAEDVTVAWQDHA